MARVKKKIYTPFFGEIIVVAKLRDFEELLVIVEVGVCGGFQG